MKDVEAMNLEQAMDEMESIAATMEEGNVPMEETMRLYERGMALSKRCRALLEGYQARIAILRDGEEKPFEL
jgi:exodeoxyribonuclease VII small subunit